MASALDNSVAVGRLGVVTLTTAYGVLCAGTTATGPVQTLASLGSTGQVLTSNGAGALPSFQAIGAGASGVVIQVVSAVFTTTATSSSTTMADTGLTVSITPSSASNKIMVVAYIPGSATTGYGCLFNLVRDSTDLNLGTTAGSRISCTAATHGDASGGIETTPISYLDSPATTSSTTYKLQFAVGPTGGTAYINRSATDTDSASFQRTAASITVMEVTG